MRPMRSAATFRAAPTAMTQHVIALLGRKDEPTDAVEEYCRYLGAALRAHDMQLEIRRVPWERHGWHAALNALRLQAATWRGTWVLVQYTALSWSERGFPQKFLRVLKILKSAGARVAIVFHDIEPYGGARLVDSFRRAIQVRTMRRALAAADLAVLTVPAEKISWRPGPGSHVAFVPVGANLPIPAEPPAHPQQTDIPTIGVFSITGGEAGARETELIIRSVRHAAQQLGPLRLCVFGRHAELRRQVLQDGLRDAPVELSVEGVISPEQVVERLSASDVVLFVRGGISTRRGSAIAAIACGTPTIGYVGSETAYPITEAGVLLVSPQIPEELPAALIRVLADNELRASLRLRNAMIYTEYLSWPAIATRFAALLQKFPSS
jgi:glycosyltransferase involved in cell wall biosynthesis